MKGTHAGRLACRDRAILNSRAFFVPGSAFPEEDPITSKYDEI